MLNGLSLFSGIGGLDVALSDWVRPIAYCEIDPYCQGVLLSRMSDGGIPYAPIWDNVTTLQGLSFCGHIDIIYGGFPCQDISIAGSGKGLAGERSRLFFEIARLCSEIKPRFIFLENVPAIISRGGTEVIRKITEMGYDCRWCVISAASVGAIHKRERFFLLAHDRSERIQGLPKEQIQGKSAIQRLEDGRGFEEFRERSNLHTPKLCGSGNGIPFRMDRTKSMGNSVCPQQAKEAFKILMGLK
jgi:DNA (cytosine-5)-methyltransferase 1